MPLDLIHALFRGRSLQSGQRQREETVTPKRRLLLMRNDNRSNVGFEAGCRFTI
jgi:hypothetical protein